MSLTVIPVATNATVLNPISEAGRKEDNRQAPTHAPPRTWAAAAAGRAQSNATAGAADAGAAVVGSLSAAQPGTQAGAQDMVAGAVPASTSSSSGTAAVDVAAGTDSAQQQLGAGASRGGGRDSDHSSGSGTDKSSLVMEQGSSSSGSSSGSSRDSSSSSSAQPWRGSEGSESDGRTANTGREVGSDPTTSNVGDSSAHCLPAATDGGKEEAVRKRAKLLAGTAVAVDTREATSWSSVDDRSASELTAAGAADAASAADAAGAGNLGGQDPSVVDEESSTQAESVAVREGTEDQNEMFMEEDAELKEGEEESDLQPSTPDASESDYAGAFADGQEGMHLPMPYGITPAPPYGMAMYHGHPMGDYPSQPMGGQMAGYMNGHYVHGHTEGTMAGVPHAVVNANGQIVGVAGMSTAPYIGPGGQYMGQYASRQVSSPTHGALPPHSMPPRPVIVGMGPGGVPIVRYPPFVPIPMHMQTLNPMSPFMGSRPSSPSAAPIRPMPIPMPQGMAYPGSAVPSSLPVSVPGMYMAAPHQYPSPVPVGGGVMAQADAAVGGSEAGAVYSSGQAGEQMGYGLGVLPPHMPVMRSHGLMGVDQQQAESGMYGGEEEGEDEEGTGGGEDGVEGINEEGMRARESGANSSASVFTQPAGIPSSLKVTSKLSSSAAPFVPSDWRMRSPAGLPVEHVLRPDLQPGGSAALSSSVNSDGSAGEGRSGLGLSSEGSRVSMNGAAPEFVPVGLSGEAARGTGGQWGEASVRGDDASGSAGMVAGTEGEAGSNEGAICGQESTGTAGMQAAHAAVQDAAVVIAGGGGGRAGGATLMADGGAERRVAEEGGAAVDEEEARFQADMQMALQASLGEDGRDTWEREGSTFKCYQF